MGYIWSTIDSNCVLRLGLKEQKMRQKRKKKWMDIMEMKKSGNELQLQHRKNEVSKLTLLFNQGLLLLPRGHE